MFFAAGLIIPVPWSMKQLGCLPRRVGEIETCWKTLSHGHHLVVVHGVPPPPRTIRRRRFSAIRPMAKSMARINNHYLTDHGNTGHSQLSNKAEKQLSVE